MTSQVNKNLALMIMAIAFVLFVYWTIKAIGIADKTQVGTSNGIYTSYVTTSEEIQEQAFNLTQQCTDSVCKVQSLLDYVSNIPYHTTTFQRYSAQKTIQQNFGDCDDKSNLLISMLNALKIEAYFVLVPQHIFVIVPLNDRRLRHKKGLWINGEKYYILETTAKNSQIGYPLRYQLSDIDTVVEPFSNKKLEIHHLEYKL